MSSTLTDFPSIDLVQVLTCWSALVGGVECSYAYTRCGAIALIPVAVILWLLVNAVGIVEGLLFTSSGMITSVDAAVVVLGTLLASTEDSVGRADSSAASS